MGEMVDNKALKQKDVGIMALATVMYYERQLHAAAR
jgi:hypothetical protein